MENPGNIRRSIRNKSKHIDYWKPPPRKQQSGNVRKWSEDEVTKFLANIQLYGHKNLKKIQEDLSGKQYEELKAFFTAQKVRARKYTLHREVDNWLNICEAEAKKNNVTKWNDSHAIAQIMKYLSVDGFLENHPLPEKCQGIDFPAAYRLIYQALMGYPMQPVNRETAKFILNSLEDLGKSVRKVSEIDGVISFLKEGCKQRDAEQPTLEVADSNEVDVNIVEIKKQVKTYQRKKKVETTEAPVLSLRITPIQQENTACSSQSYVVSLEGDEGSHNVNVPVPTAVENINSKEILNKLYESVSFNPLQIPERWLIGELKIDDASQPEEENYEDLGEGRILYRHYNRGGAGFYNKS